MKVYLCKVKQIKMEVVMNVVVDEVVDTDVTKVVFIISFLFHASRRIQRGQGSECPLPWTQIEPGHIRKLKYHGKTSPQAKRHQPSLLFTSLAISTSLTFITR